MEEGLHIAADYRERESGTARALLAAGAPLSFVQLKAGDYLVQGSLAIERKTARDFWASIFDGRLFRQVSRLSRSAQRSLLLVEGQGLDLARPAVRGTIVAIAAVFGMPILFARSPDDSAQWILTAARQLAARPEMAHVRPGWRPKGKRARQIFVLQGLPGVGPIRAEALLERFGSIRAILNAEEAALRNVPGIGAKIAGRILWLAT
ncbi:MAG TPA: ERCC4 domain-containing protein [Planctomycetota bacterium]|nr:ERCC4 domain-containing protein [Planctomycetota bacterium]